MHLSNLFMISTKQQNDLKHKLCPHTQQMIYRWVCTIKNGFFPRILKECVVRAASSTVYVAMQYVCVCCVYGFVYAKLCEKRNTNIMTTHRKTWWAVSKSQFECTQTTFPNSRGYGRKFRIRYVVRYENAATTKNQNSGEGRSTGKCLTLCLSGTIYVCMYTHFYASVCKKETLTRAHTQAMRLCVALAVAAYQWVLMCLCA